MVYVAKANPPDVEPDERYLLRRREGAFIDVTMPAPATSWEGNVVQRSILVKQGIRFRLAAAVSAIEREVR